MDRQQLADQMAKEMLEEIDRDIIAALSFYLPPAKSRPDRFWLITPGSKEDELYGWGADLGEATKFDADEWKEVFEPELGVALLGSPLCFQTGALFGQTK